MRMSPWRWMAVGVALAAASAVALSAPLGHAGFLAGVALVGYGVGVGWGDLS